MEKDLSEGRAALFNALVLAGERSRKNPLAERFQISLKAVIPVGGRPMVQRVLEALSSSAHIEQIYLCGPDKGIFDGLKPLRDMFRSGRLVWVENEKSPSLSALKAIKLSGRNHPVLLTTADHALLRTEVVDFFCQGALSSPGDLIVGLARLETIKSTWPEARRTSYRFREGRFCSCNLFGFMNKNSLNAAKFWQKIEEKRKHPLKIVRSFGICWALWYLSGSLGIEKAFERASRVIGCRIKPLIIPFPEAAIDVDSYADWKLAEKIITVMEK